MIHALLIRLLALGVLASEPAAPPESLEQRDRLAAELTGTWAGEVHEADATAVIALGITPDSSGAMTLTLSIPAVHLDHVPLGSVAWSTAGDSIRLGALCFAFDRSYRTLGGVMPAGWAPGRSIPMVLRPTTGFIAPPRAPLAGRLVEPAWTYDAGTPLWAGPTYADGALYVGGDDGVIHALDATTGQSRWSFKTSGAIRTRPTTDGTAVYCQSDDGSIYKLMRSTGKVAWSMKVAGALTRRPPGDPQTRSERFGSDVTIAGGRLYLGTHEGRVLALAAANGETVWQFKTGGAVLAAPALRDGRLYVGSMDGGVYALDARDGRLIWKRDTHGAVVSTPAIDQGRVVIGNRGNDLFGLDAASGKVEWRHYLWMSWVESSATIRDGVAYVGSSDAALLAAFDVRTGARRWSCDVQGWAWGQPVVGRERVYMTTSGRSIAGMTFLSGVLALDRTTGAVLWRYADPPAAMADYGFPGSPAYGAGMVYASDYDGRVMAFRE